MESFDFLKEYAGSFGLDPVSSKIQWARVLQEILLYAGKILPETCASVVLLIGVSVFSVLLAQNCAKDGQAMRKYTLMIMTAICAYPLVADFLKMALVAKEGISNMTALMLASIPVLTSLDLSASSGVFLLITQIAGGFMLSVFLPMILCQTALGICDSITERYTLSGIRKGIKGIFTWGLGAVMLVFGIASTLGGAVDSSGGVAAGRSLRYAGSLIPVVGRYLSESAEMIYSSASVLRSAGGIGVCIAIIACVLEPFIHILVYVVVYRIATFCIRPYADKKIIELTDAVGEGLSGLAGITILTASIALINIAVIVRNSGLGI